LGAVEEDGLRAFQQERGLIVSGQIDEPTIRANDEIAAEYAGKLKVVKLNTDEESAIAIKYGITSIPTLNVYVNGEVVKTVIGAKPKPALLKELAAFI
jgi:thioredoxin-like negative regulator of GroEL